MSNVFGEGHAPSRERYFLQILTNRRHISAGTKGYFLSLRSFQWFSSKTSFVDFDK